VTTSTFYYHLLWRTHDRTQPPVNVIAVARSTGPTQAISWGYGTESWEFRPDVAAAILYGNPEDHEFQVVDRETAERATHNFTTVPLPSEEEMTRICRETAPNWQPGS
jgi:hypothetical protein